MRPDVPDDVAFRLRREFDASFSQASRDRVPYEDLLALKEAGDSYAVRVRDIAGVFKDRRVTRLPSTRAESLGIAGIRGALIPVYDLRALLGHPPAGSCRWLLLALAPEPLGFAFDSFEGQFRVPREHLEPARPETRRHHVHQALRMGESLRQVIDVGSLVKAVKDGARPGSEER